MSSAAREPEFTGAKPYMGSWHGTFSLHNTLLDQDHSPYEDVTVRPSFCGNMDDDFDDFGVADDAVLTKALEAAERRAAQAKASSRTNTTSGAEKAARPPATVQQPLPQKINRPSGTSSIIVNTRQVI